jgi:2-polyprenyl-6-hydroxyphenyl methylase/3-demethylubiquinone-9 3-methyltransferase
MWQAINQSAELVEKNGYLLIAIYNKHWSSALWKRIKKTYNNMPSFVQKTMVWVFSVIIFAAKWLLNFKNPLKKERGMNFYYDVIDWIGGYPYEYASKTEIYSFLEDKGFVLKSFYPSTVPTGCYEYVFQRSVQNNITSAKT